MTDMPVPAEVTRLRRLLTIPVPSGVARLCIGTSFVLPVLGVGMMSAVSAPKSQDDWAWLIAGALSVLLGTGLHGIIEWRRFHIPIGERRILRIAMKDALQPVVECMSAIPYMTKPQRLGALRKVADRSVAALKLIFSEKNRLRAVVFELCDGNLTCLAYVGRGRKPGGFEAGTLRGDRALEVVRNGGTLLVPNLDTEVPEQWEGSGKDYRGFISVAITNGEQSYGLLTVDTPETNSLDDTDLQIVLLMADLLAIAFAEADRK